MYILSYFVQRLREGLVKIAFWFFYLFVEGRLFFFTYIFFLIIYPFLMYMLFSNIEFYGKLALIKNTTLEDININLKKNNFFLNYYQPNLMLTTYKYIYSYIYSIYHFIYDKLHALFPFYFTDSEYIDKESIRKFPRSLRKKYWDNLKIGFIPRKGDLLVSLISLFIVVIVLLGWPTYFLENNIHGEVTDEPHINDPSGFISQRNYKYNNTFQTDHSYISNTLVYMDANDPDYPYDGLHLMAPDFFGSTDDYLSTIKPNNTLLREGDDTAHVLFNIQHKDIGLTDFENFNKAQIFKVMEPNVEFDDNLAEGGMDHLEGNEVTRLMLYEDLESEFDYYQLGYSIDRKAVMYDFVFLFESFFFVLFFRILLIPSFLKDLIFVQENFINYIISIIRIILYFIVGFFLIIKRLVLYVVFFILCYFLYILVYV